MLRPWKDNHLKIPEIRSRQKQGDDYGHHHYDYGYDYDHDDDYGHQIIDHGEEKKL